MLRYVHKVSIQSSSGKIGKYPSITTILAAIAITLAIGTAIGIFNHYDHMALAFVKIDNEQLACCS